MDADLTYTLQHDGDSMPVLGSLTLGRHIDNQSVIAGEDVLDFHLRLELMDRGPQALPLGNSNFTVNGREFDRPVGLVVGDVLGVGSTSLVIGVERDHASRIRGWRLVDDRSGNTTEIANDLLIGRHPECGLQVESEHVSRRHARLLHVVGALWLQDLGSANGTRVNGKQVIGGCRLFHGDFLQFDEAGFRLHAIGENLTVIRDFSAADLQPFKPELNGPGEPPSVKSVDVLPPVEPSVRRRTTTMPKLQPGQARLVGLTEPIVGRVWPISLGRSRLGHGSQCDIRIEHGLLAELHAEIVTRPEHTVITALQTQAGIVVNGHSLRVSDLGDGDTIEMGGLQFRFQQARAVASDRMVGWKRLAIVIVIAIVLTAAVLALF